ncbi:MAG: bifunctional homocysteine S-methyltransferase/methylenetetrahydrofolate reductase [Gemmatimonadetes bacterium]|nr:bifunctional homocysteine S-methyltransferase/methylenetetrahydrofolate reductase [Gemmatimonadota bacterium]NIO32910.1 bifunctional homocysteine S-methyltransferase/methylenetetrahydrofolate reductase [Gemmatimonadota bacterium]
MPDFRALIENGGAHLFDGAIGTELYQRGVFINVSYDEVNLKSPELVRQVHRAYREAGAEVLETNTFGANRVRLDRFSLGDRVYDINKAGAELAREVAADDRYVGGSIGPLGIRIEPYGPTAREEARAFFREQAEGLAAGGVDVFIIETFGDLSEIEQAVLGCRDAADLPIIAQMAINPNGNTVYGYDPARIAHHLDELGADVIGLNCSVGPALILKAIQIMARLTSRPLSAMPNAGLPREIEGRKIYMASPDYFAKYTRRLIQAGARFVGGCCGTTPEHTRAMAAQVRALRPGRHTVLIDAVRDVERREAHPGVEPVPAAERSQLGRKIVSGELVTSVEILPARGCDPSDILDKVHALQAAGVDAVNVPDGPRAMMRMGVLASCAIIEREVGLETIPHYCCRDRNLLGMMSDLLGAHALGLRNLLIITGDPPKHGPYPDSTAVFDIDSVGLTNLVRKLNEGLDLSDNSLGSATSFFHGVGVNHASVDPDYEIHHFEWKVDAGAQFAVTQPVFDAETFLGFLEKIDHVRIPTVAAVWPLVSYRNAEFMANEVPGVVVPDAILGRMQRASDSGKEAAMDEGLAIAREMVETLEPHVQGVQVSAPFGKVGFALQVFDALSDWSGPRATVLP